MYVVPQLRQTENTNDKYNSNSESGSYKYQRLINVSMSNSEGSLNVSNEADNYPYLNAYLHTETGPRLIKSTSDQQIPESSDHKYLYVNKNGHVSQMSSSLSKPVQCNQKPSQFVPKNNEVVCSAFLVDMAKSSKINSTGYREFNNDKQNLQVPKERNVPTMANDLNKSSSDSSHNNSIVTKSPSGVRINTSLAIQEPNIEITYEHVKYINIFSILCCWCFPITGILSIIYARITAKYYNLRELNKAKKYLKRSEWLLIATLFCGFTLISIIFALLQHSFFTEIKNRNGNSFNHGSAGSFPFFLPR